MKSVISILKMEWMKFYKDRWIVIFFVLVIGSSGVYCYLNHINSIEKSDWKNNLKIELDVKKAELEQLEIEFEEEPQLLESVKKVYVEDIMCYEYAIYNNIPFNVNSVWKDLYGSKVLIYIITVALIIFCTSSIYDEYQYKTIKQIVSSFTNRKKWLFGKFLFFSLITLAIIVVHILGSFIFGVCLDGFEKPITLIVENEQVKEINMIVSLIKYYSIAYLFELIVIIISQGMSIFLKNPMFSSIITLMVAFGDAVLSKFFCATRWYKYTIFPNINLSKKIYNVSGMLTEPVKAISILVINVVIFIVLYVWYFDKKDI